MTGMIEERLKVLGITLPTATPPAANYVPVVESGGLLYISGQLPMGPSGLQYKGTLGVDCDVPTGREAARLCAIHILAQAKAALGDLERIGRVVKITGFVASAQNFGDQPEVMNGGSDLLVEALGERGRHARSSVGVAALPRGAPVEIEAIIAIA